VLFTGAGILVGIPHRYFKKLSISGQLPFSSLPPAGRYGVGMIFLPNGEGSEKRRAELMDNIEKVIQSFGLSVLGWRSPLPTKSTILGSKRADLYVVLLNVCFPLQVL
jgi:glutamate synthase domain-containing protein 1